MLPQIDRITAGAEPVVDQGTGECAEEDKQRRHANFVKVATILCEGCVDWSRTCAEPIPGTRRSIRS